MKFARATYWLAAIYGILVLLPGFFLEDQFSRTSPPALTHPEFYYGFYGSALVWQFAFILIARSPSPRWTSAPALRSPRSPATSMSA